MEDFEKLGVFYLGREYDLAQGKAKETLLLYDSKDLVTHAVCVGMTGSGKTGLCIGLIEEAAIDGVPAILIDPKGDLANLLLTFPELRGADFAPWINEDEARQKGVAPLEYANQQAELWRKGLADWGQSGERIQRLREAADFAIYTPGSTAGLPVSILASFAAPPRVVLEDDDLLRERVLTTVNSLLGLLGITADPIQSREHILLSTIFDLGWRGGQDFDLAALIRSVQEPPVSKIGVLDLESFYPAGDRFALVMALNNLLASPGFDVWMQGQALDIGDILYTSQGKPRVAIFYIAHLSDAERMFFVSLLLNQVLGWIRGQPGTTSLRAIVYMDEIFGYFPPVANPPSKLPMLTLLKQARAFGLGMVLATQNPVDLDYKGLANAGTWFIGRLQTERDKARLLDGLEGASATTGMAFDRQGIEDILGRLGKRVFLMNNVHENAPVLFQTRWAMSYLRGPLTRDQIKALMEGRRPAVAKEAPPAARAVTEEAPPTPQARVAAGQPPALPPEVNTFYVTPRTPAPVDGTLVYQARVAGAARVRFADRAARVDAVRDVVFLAHITDKAIPVDWASAQEAGFSVSELERNPRAGATYLQLPTVAGQPKSYANWSRDFADWLYRGQALELWRSSSLGETSQPGESERDFRVRLQQLARQHRDEAVEKLRQKYAPKLATLQERIRRAQQAVDREQTQAKQQGLQTAVSVGATLLGALMGRKAVSTSTLGRATTAARAMGRSASAREDISRAQETLRVQQERLAELQAQFDADVAALETKIDPLSEALATLQIRPKKTDTSVQLVALAWAPYWRDTLGNLSPAW